MLASALVGLAACSSPATPPPPPPQPTATAETSVPDPPKATSVSDAKPAAVVLAGQNFADEARLLYRVVTCKGDTPVTPEIAAVLEEHCKDILPRIENFKKTWLDVAQPALAAIVPADAPKKVVYPFAGGDNTTLLATVPNADEYTSISLELVGDVRRVRELQPATLASTLRKLRVRIDELIGDSKFSMSETLQKMMTGELPQELSFLMVGLSIHDLEPVSLRYFRLEKDGAVHYFTAEELAKEKGSARRRAQTWQDGDFPEAFSNVEIGFKPRGKDGPVRVQRHIAFNLDNQHVKFDPSLLAHLAEKGDVSMMIKAASYLLWKLDFSRIRDYVLKHPKFIVSDSTAPLPRDAVPAGYVQEVWGSFTGARIPVVKDGEREMRKFWETQPDRPLAFRFGYLDRNDKAHLMVTRRK